LIGFIGGAESNAIYPVTDGLNCICPPLGLLPATETGSSLMGVTVKAVVSARVLKAVVPVLLSAVPPLPEKLSQERT